MTTGRPQRSTGFRGSGPRRGGRRFFTRRKVCAFCVNHVKHIDYKSVDTLTRYITDQAKMESRRKSGVCAKHQRGLATAIKRARYLAMIPFSRIHRTGSVHTYI